MYRDWRMIYAFYARAPRHCRRKRKSSGCFARIDQRGEGKIEEAYPKLCAKLKNNSVRLVSSPLVRARQTAEVFGKLLDVEVELRDWVAAGEMNELIRCIDETRDDVLIVVGHEPTLSYWCERFGFKVGWMKKDPLLFLK